MENFTFRNPTKIIFGKGAENQISRECKEYRKILLHFGGGSIKRSGLYDRVTAALRAAGIEWIELPGVKPNPDLNLVYQGIQLCRDNGTDLILAVGGGSVIDSAKAIAMGACYQGDVWDFFENKASLKEMLPVGVILTIAAAGSESSDSAVITKGEGLLKRPFAHSLLFPRFAILNPELTFTLPPFQTACGAADITAHILERYFTKTTNVDLTDRLCEAALKTIIANAPRALANPSDYDARAEIMWTGALAHNNLLGTGRVADWGSHMIEHEISGMYDVAHGAGLAVVFPAWMQYVYREDLPRFVQYALRVWDVHQADKEPEQIALEGIQCTRQFFKSLDLPVSFQEMGITAGRIEEMAEKSTRNGALGQFKKLYQADVLEILRLAQ